MQSILGAFQDFHTELLTPRTEKTGQYGTEVPIHYPWQQEGAPRDGYEGIHSTCTEQQRRESLLNAWNLVNSDTTFQDTLNHMANNKGLGPDGVPNELLKCAPRNVQTHIHTLIKCMWQTGYTPTCLKRSDTVLLYKKGDAADISNY